MYAKIQPVFVGLPPVSCDTLRITNVTCNALGIEGQATIQWAVTGDAPGAYQGGSSSLNGPAYQAWGANDEYLFIWLASTLGLTITEIVPDAASTSPVASPAPVEAPVAPPVAEEPVVAEEPAVAPLEADPAAGSI